jgi:hypothetical protein
VTAREGRQIIERVLEHLNYARATAYDEADWLAYVEASATCASIIQGWNKSKFALKAAA